jgi:hypothetical protein
VFVCNAKIETICDDLTGDFIDENRQPFHDGEGHIIYSHAFNDAIPFHAVIIPGDLRSKSGDGGPTPS